MKKLYTRSFNTIIGKRFFILMITMLFLAACSRMGKRESFEGIITYKVTFTPKSGSPEYLQYQKEKYGDEMKLFIARTGDFKREYIGSGPKGYDFFIYRQALNEAFTKWKNKDTVYISDCRKNSLKQLSEYDLNNVTIQGVKCKGYSIGGADSKGGQFFTLTYICPENKEYINPGLYKGYGDFFYKKIIAKMKAPYYRMEMTTVQYSVTFDMEKIEERAISPDIFTAPIPNELRMKLR